MVATTKTECTVVYGQRTLSELLGLLEREKQFVREGVSSSSMKVLERNEEKLLEGLCIPCGTCGQTISVSRLRAHIGAEDCSRCSGASTKIPAQQRAPAPPSRLDRVRNLLSSGSRKTPRRGRQAVLQR